MTKSKSTTMDTKFEHLSREELIRELTKSRSETYKYVNKFLELEEKWTFINHFLKQLNSLRKKNDLCPAICEGFLQLTNSKVCACCRFNQDEGTIECKQIKYNNIPKRSDKSEKLTIFLDTQCIKFIKQGIEFEKIEEFFEQNSNDNIIIVPIRQGRTLSAYLFLENENENFYKENINFIKIFPEHIGMILENISLYEESEKANKRKIEFLAGISHEFKTPLNSIIGFTEILEEKIKNIPSQEFIKNYIGNILNSSKHLLTLIEDILDVSKSQYNKLELNYTTFSPKNEIIQIINTLDNMIKDKNINIAYTLVDINLKADLKRFRQLIYNLTSNAIKFNKQNGTISLLTYVKENKFIFEISDTGDGISKKDYEKIFDFFSQVNRSQLKRQLGSGVGLALCKMITEAHHGEIDFKSQIKKGSQFWFSIPIEQYFQ